MRYLISLIALLAVLTGSFVAMSFESGPAEKRLNFILDNDLKILSASNENMAFYKPASEFVGKSMVGVLPLSVEKAQNIDRAFGAARRTKQTTQIHYEFDPFANNPNMGVAYPTTQRFRAEITPMFSGSGAPSGFFVKVVPVTPPPFPLGGEE